MKTVFRKKRARLGTDEVEYATTGTGRPTIVLINGAGGPLEGWHKVFAELGTLGTVIAYNRPGMGKSSSPREAQTGDVMVDLLRRLLVDFGLVPPYVLVGHSLGGLIANLFARTYPGEVAGVVLLDATAPADVAEMAAFETTAQRLVRRLFDRLASTDEYGETAQLGRTVEQIVAAPAFPDVPIVVVSGGRSARVLRMSPAARAARAVHQRELVALSPRGGQIVAGGSGHFPQLTEPALVVEAVRRVIEVGGDGFGAQSGEHGSD